MEIFKTAEYHFKQVMQKYVLNSDYKDNVSIFSLPF